jgi:hypothetical protein
MQIGGAASSTFAKISVRQDLIEDEPEGALSDKD